MQNGQLRPDLVEESPPKQSSPKQCSSKAEGEQILQTRDDVNNPGSARLPFTEAGSLPAHPTVSTRRQRNRSVTERNCLGPNSVLQSSSGSHPGRLDRIQETQEGEMEGRSNADTMTPGRLDRRPIQVSSQRTGQGATIQLYHSLRENDDTTEESLRGFYPAPPDFHLLQNNSSWPIIGSDQRTEGFTTQIAPAMVPDIDLVDESYAESTTTSYVTSLASEITRGVVENERLYPNYGQHTYGMPIDEEEMDRMDLQHRKYELVLDGKHFLAPIGLCPQRILDLGTGTGIWALDIADMFPSAQVIGVDIAPIQPKWVAANCQFEIDDVEATWTFRKNSFDFIHFRDPLFCIRDWPKLVKQCFDHLKPGGWCELACIYPVVMCDDATMPDDSGFKVICEKFMEASAIVGTPTSSPIRFARYLQDAGFTGVSENIFKIPSSPWPKDKRLKKIGALEMTNVVEGASAFGLRAFAQAFGWSRDETEVQMISFRRDVKNRSYHQYCQ